MPGRLRQRPVLTPAGDAAVDEAGVAREAIVGAEPEPLGDARPEPLDQRVGALDEAPRQRLPAGAFRSTTTERRPRSSKS